MDLKLSPDIELAPADLRRVTRAIVAAIARR